MALGGWAGDSLGVAGWRLKPARKGSEQQGASEGKTFPLKKETYTYEWN